VIRVLIACVKYLGEWLCIRCGIRLEDVHHLGMKQDMKNRERLRRELTDPLLRKVEDARKAIFESGGGVEGDAVKRILDSGSMTTTRVCPFLFTLILVYTHVSIRIPS
jgi:hypothetical protein